MSGRLADIGRAVAALVSDDMRHLTGVTPAARRRSHDHRLGTW
jgi:hypothetical protein